MVAGKLTGIVTPRNVTFPVTTYPVSEGRTDVLVNLALGCFFTLKKSAPLRCHVSRKLSD